MAKKKPIELLGYAELSALTSITANTLRQWALRGKLPDPDFRVGQSPAWLPETIDAWRAQAGIEEAS